MPRKLKYFIFLILKFSFLRTALLKFPQWITSWFHFMFSYDKLLFISGFFGILSIPFLKKKVIITSLFYRNIFFLAIVLQLLSWFFIAPDPRFIYGCLLCGIMSMFILLARQFLNRVSKKTVNIVMMAFLSSILIFTVFKICKEGRHDWIFPLKLPEPPIRTVMVGKIQIHIPEKIINNWNPRCYGTSLPCAYEVDPRLQPRGATIADGFRLRK